MDNGNMNNKGYHVFTIDVFNSRIFVTRKPIVPKDESEELMLNIDTKIELIDLNSINSINPEFRVSDCEVVDITDWEYENIADLRYRINNYDSSPKRK